VGGDEGDSTSVANKEFLSEEHTIADSVTTIFDSEFGEDGKSACGYTVRVNALMMSVFSLVRSFNIQDDTDTDDYLAHGDDAKDNAQAAAAARQARLAVPRHRSPAGG